MSLSFISTKTLVDGLDMPLGSLGNDIKIHVYTYEARHVHVNNTCHRAVCEAEDDSDASRDNVLAKS